MADTAAGGQQQQQQQPKGWGALRKHVMDYKIDVALWATRIANLLFTIGYFIPLFWYECCSVFCILVLLWSLNAHGHGPHWWCVYFSLSLDYSRSTFLESLRLLLPSLLIYQLENYSDYVLFQCFILFLNGLDTSYINMSELRTPCTM